MPGIHRKARDEDNVIRKFEERYEELEKRAMEKRGVTNKTEMLEVVKKELKVQAGRINIAEHRKLNDHTIQVNPKNEEINKLRKHEQEETTKLYKTISPLLATYSTLESKIVNPLPGRVKEGAPPHKGIPAA